MRKIFIFLLYILASLSVHAQTDTIRYVKPTDKGGAYANDGKSWSTAKNNIQDAINDLRSYLEQNNLHGGSVYVASGTYEPTEGVEGGASGQLSTSFIIYDGIHVFGGFNADKPEQKPEERVLTRMDKSKDFVIGSLTAGDTTVVRWQMKYPTVLSGNHNHTAQGTFTWNANRHRYDTRFPGNSYHVVFFASNGFIQDAAHPGYADTLKYRTIVDGFTIQDGNASGATDVRQGGRDHTSMGGGVYMVKNSVVSNCIIQKCSAAMRGGGVYMDGGGELIHSLVRQCQTLGSGVSGGYGGGVCIDNNGEVHRSWITRNVARMGGGAAIISYPENHPRGAETTYRAGVFDPYISATIVSNNSSTTEAGGIYLDRGGIVNHVTVVRNENNGRDISYGRTRYGRSGGVYIYGAGQVYNSVVWGNKCAANNDIQYAATTSGVTIPSYIRLRQPFIGYTAFNNLDITNFTGSVRFNAYSFETENNDSTRSGNFALFMNPPATAGAGISEQNLRVWYPFSKTSLQNKAVQLSAYSTQAFSVMSIANQDLFDKDFEPISTLGAVETGMENIETALVEPVNKQDAKSSDTSDAPEKIPTLFVDPNRVFDNPSHSSGSSWDNPLDNISEAIQYFREHTPKNGKFQILVKQGSMTTAGLGAYYSPETSAQSDIFLASIRMMPNLLLYGGFPSTLTKTDISVRNPKDYATRISGDIISSDYRYNAMHVVSFSVAHDAVLDGFQIYYGNAQNSNRESAARGGGIVCGSEYYRQSDRVDMTNNVVRNCVIANCSGPQGAAVFVGGSYPGANGKVKADLKIENCVINNNASTQSIIHASGDATITMSHCTLIGNVTGEAGSMLATSAYNGDQGQINITNSAFHGNAKTVKSSINAITTADIPTLTIGNNITAENNLIDSLYANNFTGFTKVFGFNTNNVVSYPNFTNPIRNVGVAENTADNTVYGGTADFTPLDMNPMVNRASASGDHTTWGTDLTATVSRDYGGAPDVGALECHQLSSSNENGGQPTYGSVIYVRDYNTYDEKGDVATADAGTDGRDGTSWEKAINGNGSYSSTTSTYSYENVTSSQLSNALKVSTSTAAAENKYKIGTHHPSDPSDSYRYAKGNSTDNYINSTLTQGDADDFIFLTAGNNTYYIYDVTAAKYATYTDVNAGSNKVVLSDNNSRNATWRFHVKSNGAYGILPGSQSDGNTVAGWNYYGGNTGNIGLYRNDDVNANWQLWLRTATSTTTTENGLQYAVDKSSSTQSTDKPQVWVSEGYYTNKSTEQVNDQNYAYRMAEGVNVYGGFPKQGNPSMNERDPKAYVSVLQPQNIDPTDTTSTFIKNSEPSVARVLVQPNDFSTETSWNGFTIRYGYLQNVYQRDIKGNINNIHTENIGTSGGAGAYLMENGVLENCELLRNVILVDPEQKATGKLRVIDGNDPGNSGGGYHQAGAGVYITTTNRSTGVGGTLKNCVVAYNELLHKFTLIDNDHLTHTNPESVWMYGAGVYQDRGIIYNTIIHDNAMLVYYGNTSNSTNQVNEVLVGAGAFLVRGQFYNNTIVNNTAKTYGKGQKNIHIIIPGVYVYTDITMYNSIVSDNTSDKDDSNGNKTVFDVPVCAFKLEGNSANERYTLDASKVKVHYSYINIAKDNANNLCDTQDKNNTNIYLDNNQGVVHTPNYTSAQIYNDSTYRLVAGSPCVNHGEGDIDGITIPSYDASYADRVQDCAIDIGAYEFNGAEMISPRTGTEPFVWWDNNRQRHNDQVNLAEYFVTQNGHGDASANSPANAACATKLQRVLDAAGRYKYLHPHYRVVVRLEALPDSAGYTPSRSAATVATEQTNPRSYSIIVPMGVELEGGWPTNGNFGIDKDGKLHGRDPINNMTRLTGIYQSGTENVNVYHVVTFTDVVYDENGKPNGQILSDRVHTYIPDIQVRALNNAFDRAKLDGLYIEDGQATGNSNDDQNGGAAIMPYYAHVADCIVRSNTATGYGGAFFMQPGACIEGSIFENNNAGYGGAVAVQEVPDSISQRISSWALLLNNTVVGNNATTRGGGLWFNNNARTWNCVYWNNTSAEQNDISGITSTENTQNIINCPVNFCAVTNLVIAGNGNIDLSTDNDKGVRWGKDTNLRQKHNYDFFVPSRASVLSRAGMPYDVMHTMLRYLPGVDTLDLAGVSRLEYTEEDASKCDTAYDGEKLAVKYNYQMDIGARALNQGFSITIDPKHPLYRLFVAHPENMQANLANAMMESNDDTYKQQGSSFANPFLRLTDALNYVVDARKRYPDISKNKRFEIFIAEGTYMPFADMLGDQQNVRTRTFAVPEMVSLIGGIDATDSKNLYCQDSLDVDKTKIINVENSTITLIAASTDSIRLKRQRFDLNQNSIVEPWEMEHATVLSGFSEGSDLTVKNVYHVITSVADPTIVGEQPTMYDNNGKETNNRDSESYASRGKRAIIIDGLTITNGSATNFESSVRNRSMYFRGGGIFIAGNLLHESDENIKGTSDMSRGSRNIPVVISNSLFQNNQARQGGAIFTDGALHLVGCSFVQNLAVSPSPSETEDLQNVTFSGGGAVATNAEVFATNTIFANNEARDGGGKIVIDENGTNKRKNVSISNQVDKGGNPITITNDANAIRGYGGVIWAGDSATVRMINCNSVRNKAHAYASIYNCTPNTSASGTGHRHFGVNCIFWGNQVDAGQDSLLMNYNKATMIGGLYFSAYQNGKGLPPTVTPNVADSVYQKTIIKGGYNDLFNLDEILGHANHNIIINDDNNAVDGPNFTLPSNVAGIDGYMPSADWVPSRINALCDAGWGSIRQTTEGKFEKEPNIDFNYKTTWFINGVYGLLADFYMREFNLTLLPQGDEKYMMFADEAGDESSRNMDRISSDPLGTVTRDFIDIGVYEYQHQLLHIADGSEVDELWVSDTETTGNNNGESFYSPTSDLQRAIQTLLLSRNNHPKVIHMMQGTYSPIYEQDNGDIGFVIRTNPNISNVSLPYTIVTGYDYQATSLTILGGYSKDIEGLRDVNQYPTILKMNRRDYASDANTAHLFYVVNAEQWGTHGNGTESGSVKNTKDITKTAVSEGKALPIVLDGLTFVNTYANPNHHDIKEDGSSTDPTDKDAVATAGAAIYYREQFRSSASTWSANGAPDKDTEKHLEQTENAPKLTISNCKFYNNGVAGAATVPAVYIGEGGGKTLIYNSLFNSNSGAPIVSMDPVDIVNCTFARNGGHITMNGNAKATSTLSNSIIWQDDSAATGNKTYYEGFEAANVQNNAISGIANTDETANNHNVGLSDTNSDPMEGPNFVNITTSRGLPVDYRLNPGMRTMDKASESRYNTLTSVIKDGVKKDTIVILKPNTTLSYDLSWGARKYGNGLDRGAYECRIDQQRVLYVIPTKTTGTMTGTSWENAYGQGQLQTAIDAAAVYSYQNQDGNGKRRRSYVLVKGEANNTAAENRVSLRDGVAVYGSIPDNYLISISGKRAENDDQLKNYIDSALAARPGIAARSTRRSRILGIRTYDSSYNSGALLDGFEVRSGVSLNNSVVNVTQPVVLSKLIIDGNTITGTNDPAINMEKGLMYNCLVYGNKPASGQPVMRLGKSAVVLNSTIVSNSQDVKAIDGQGFLANSITFGFNTGELSGTLARGTGLDTLRVNKVEGIPFAPYLTVGVNPYRLSAYITGFTPYQYQLNESSQDIAGGEPDMDKILTAAKAEALGGDNSDAYNILNNATKTYNWIDFSTDCDLLGNNRLLGQIIDRGCFETWHIRQNNDITATADQYPHEGSVVYIMDNANLSLGENQTDKIFTNDNPFRPAFLLMRPGASLYGNGNVIQLSYVAADAVLRHGMKSRLISLPFRYKISEMLKTTISENGQIDAVPYKIKSAQIYNGRKRAAWNYHFNADNSDCWEDIDTSRVIPANTGWLATLPDDEDIPEGSSLTLRLVSYGEVDGDYVYTEGNGPKTITLNQYDERPNDGSAHFTKAENMGWNIMGLPYLVSNYRLGNVTETEETKQSNESDLTDYPMHLPHVIYDMDNNGKYKTVQSWLSDATATMGDGFLTQTAVNGNTETVTFELPVKEEKKPAASAKPMIAVRSANGTTEDELQINASETAKTLQYAIGSDGVKWMPMDKRQPSIYAVAASGTPMSLASEAPVNTDIPIIIGGDVNDSMTVAISDTAAFSKVDHVWLKNNATGETVDLKEMPMMLGASTSQNFTLRLGGMKPNGSRKADATDVRIYLTGRTLHVEGLKSNDSVGVYTISGQLYKRGLAEDNSYSCELHPGVYVVRAGGRGQAVAVK